MWENEYTNLNQISTHVDETRLKIFRNPLLWQCEPLRAAPEPGSALTLSSIVTSLPSTVAKEGANSWATTACTVSMALRAAPEPKIDDALGFSFAIGRGASGLVVRKSCIVFSLFSWGMTSSDPLGTIGVFPLRLTRTVFLLDISLAKSDTMVRNDKLNPGSTGS